MALRFFNTYPRKIEEFEPRDSTGNAVSIYTCGPTVYSRAHIGNFRAYIFEDLLQRHLESRGYRVHRVMNLTDVDDKTIRGAREANVSLEEYTKPFKKAFFEDLETLRLKRADEFPAARESRYIARMIEMISQLRARDLAYQAEDKSVYFRIKKFPNYGKLAHLNLDELRPSGRVRTDEYEKENIGDFALWKAWDEEDGEVGWDSPWGRGRPGWHLECSAMAMKYLGETLDIHCGGIDLVFPHHEDEIAQSEGSTGKPFSRFWCHGEFLLTDGSKMAKRLGNVATVQDLRDQGVPAAAFRHFVFSTHYRKQLNMSGEAIEASMEGVRRIGDFAQRLSEAKGATPDLEKIAEDAEAEVTSALFDDLNAPIALGALFTFVRKANAELDRNAVDKRALDTARSVFTRINSVLDVVPEAAGPDPEVARWVEERLTARKDARSRRDFAAADQIRAEIESRGIAIEDTPHGTKWRAR